MKITKTTTVILAAAALSGLFSFRAVSNAWNVAQEGVKITFTMPEGKKHGGTITGLDATIDFNPDSTDLAVIKASVNVKELKADNEKLTGHLMTADFFDAENHPKITFTGEKVTKSETGFVATGKLAMRDSVHTVNIPFTFEQEKGKAVMKGTLEVFAGDYGVGKKSSSGADKVIVTIEVPVTKE
jgi:polyisoprenoid-binding protein YceI